MSTTNHLSEIVLRWEEALQREGRSIPVEELCKDCPELIPLVRDHIERLRPIYHTSDHQVAEAIPPLPHPSRLGRYRVTAVLGSGGFGVVYRADDDTLRRDVAIKVPHRHRLASAADTETYLAEARVVAGLDHPAIVPVHDVGRAEDGLCYVVSRFIEGGDLRGRLLRGRPPFAESALLVARVAEGLHHAHRRGLVHRDVKPANILLDLAGQPYIADFGLALKEEDFGRGPRSCGTPAYMSPEQARGEGHRVDARSDVYSLGVVLYELLCGRRPFTAESVTDLLEQIQALEPRPPRQLDDAVPRELDRICLKAIAKRASDRYSTALDLAEELRQVHAQPAEAGPPTQVERAPARSAALSTSGNTPATDAGPVKVVPKGLRSFDASDAGFFLELLPGPRDRDGLPESVRFWKARLEQTDPELTFSVGLMYGPSGCGKSSLVKAGLLPWLAGHVLPVYVEATPDGTEGRLGNALIRRCPDLAGAGLPDMLGRLRRGQALPSGKKVVLVLDQFEQWLHAHAAEPHAELVRALRQCDGCRVQCVVLVRDDFWMAVTRFFRELEVSLQEGHNSAAVDRFDPRHAQHVLAVFGRAFAALPEGPLQPEQQRFLEKATEALAEDGKVICVRLALFAAMVKARPWVPATLKEAGGAEGIGVRFLEESLAAPTAPPECRLHQKAARAVLRALLPEAGTEIKGHMRSHAELLDISGYAARPGDFNELLRILDTQLRLVTPTDPASQTAAAAGRYYQLTHDYLVPALRLWLTRKQRETARGRAELRLSERSALGTPRPEGRQLPGWWEWLSIRLWTRKREWTAPERKMMARANRYHGVRAVVAVVLLGLLGWGALEGHGWLRASQYVAELAQAPVKDVPQLGEKLRAYRRWADRPLARMAEPGLPDGVRVKAALVLVAWDETQVDYLRDRLLDPALPPSDVGVIVAALEQHKERLVEGLWEAAQAAGEAAGKGREAVQGRRLRAACALAEYDAASQRWEDVAVEVVVLLVRQDPLAVAEWAALLRPAHDRLLPMLQRVCTHGIPHAAEGVKRLAATILADYAHDRPQLLVEALLESEPASFAVLFARLKQHGTRAAALLQREFDAPPPAGPVDANLRRRLEQADGMLAEKIAFCQSAPLGEFRDLAERLGKVGYRPVQVRPFVVDRAVRVAAIWARDRKRWQMVLDGSAAEVRAKDRECRSVGYSPIEAVGFAAGPQGERDERYVAVWVEGRPAAQLLLGLSTEEYVERVREFQAAGFTMAHYQVFAGGRPRHTALLRGDIERNLSAAGLVAWCGAGAFQALAGLVPREGGVLVPGPPVGKEVMEKAAAAAGAAAAAVAWSALGPVHALPAHFLGDPGETAPEDPDEVPPAKATWAAGVVAWSGWQPLLPLPALFRQPGVAEKAISIIAPDLPSALVGRRGRLAPSAARLHQEDVARAAARLRSHPNDAEARYTRARANYFLGDDARAVEDLSALIATGAKAEGRDYRLAAHLFRTLALARLGDGEAARRDVAAFRESADAKIGALLEAAVAVFGEDSLPEIKRLLPQLQSSLDSDQLYQAACVHAQAADVVAARQPASSKRYAADALWLLHRAVVNGDGTILGRIPGCRALHALLDHPDFPTVPTLLQSQQDGLTREGRKEQLLSEVSPAQHLHQARLLARRSYRPAVVAVLARDGRLVVNAAWTGPDQRNPQPRPEPQPQPKPEVEPDGKAEPEPEPEPDGKAEPEPEPEPEADPEAELEPELAGARRQAYAAAALLRLGSPGRAQELLRPPLDAPARACLIHLLGHLGVEADVLLEQLKAPAADPHVRRALVLALGGGPAAPAGQDPRPVNAELLRLYREDPDPGVHSAAGWALRRRGQGEGLHKALARLARPEGGGNPSEAGGRRWDVTSEYHTLAALRRPDGVLLCTPEKEGRYSAWLRPGSIGHHYAIATHPVTMAQFRRFLEANPSVRPGRLRSHTRSEDGPVVGVNWYEAAMYCRWLSEKEGVPEAQMCYPPIKDIKEGMKWPADYLSRTGYRLPTEAEWEHACSASVGADRSFFAARRLVTRSAAHRGESMPNDNGLFDGEGEVWEWCANRAQDGRRRLRSGLFGLRDPQDHQSPHWSWALDQPDIRNFTVGLRVARTLVADGGAPVFPPRPKPPDRPPVGRAAGEPMPAQKAGVEEGEARLVPWSGYWFKTREGKMLDSLRKYDQLTGKKAHAWESQNKDRRTAAPWAGYDHAWSAAAILEKEPRAGQWVTGATGQKVYLSVADQKALLTVMHDGDDARIFGSRFNGGAGEDPQDIYPDVLWKALREHVRWRRVPLVMDIDAGAAVWNYPVYRYRVSYGEAGPEGLTLCKMELWMADDNVGPDFVGTKTKLKEYQFTCRMHGSTAVPGSAQWYGISRNDHPDFAWYPKKANPSNPHIDPLAIRRMLGATPGPADH